MPQGQYVSRRVQILMMEDSRSQARLMQEALAEARVPSHVTVVPDGVEGLAFLRQEGIYVSAPRPDVILLDLNMPKMNGHEVLAVVKSDADLRSIPVLVLSSSRADEDIQKAYDLHANCYILKPALLDDFIAVVRAIDDFWLRTVTFSPRLKKRPSELAAESAPFAPTGGTSAHFV